MLCRRVTEFVRLHEMQGATVVIMALANEIVAAFAIKDPIKPEAGAVVKALKKAGIKASSALPSSVRKCDLPQAYLLACSVCIEQGKVSTSKMKVKSRLMSMVMAENMSVLCKKGFCNYKD